ncbi:MAG: Flp family type IVb pilin [Burkholderiales bacterium]|nr:Flp family type IVb pilin [Burkholderiales bacterium]
MEKLALATGRFLRDEEGVTAIEYGLIAALVGVAAIAALQLLGTGLTDIFTKVANCLSSPATC